MVTRVIEEQAVASVLFDLSVLRTEARVRGIGRYVADLAVGLDRAQQATEDVRIIGIERVHWNGTATVARDLAAALDRLHEAPLENHWSWAYRQRVSQARAARRLRPDLVHTGHPNATPLGRFSCPRVVTCHDLIPLRYPKQYLDWRDGYRRGREWLDTRRYSAADHVIAVSESTANDLVTLLGVSPSRITVVYNGVDLTRWSAEPQIGDSSVCERHGLSPRSYVLYVGAADWRKNSDGMLKALAALKQRKPSSELVLAWAAHLDEESATRVRQQAEQLGVTGSLLLLGYVSDAELAALYRNALAQLFVSRSEGFGYPLVEAMAAGCPVITSDLSSLAEIAGNGAIQVDPENPEAIAEAILTLAGNAAERQRWHESGIDRARQFSLERMASDTLAVYRTLLRR